MPQKIGPKRLQRLIDQGVNPAKLPLEERVAVSIAMMRILSQPPACTPKRERPRCGAKCRTGWPCRRRAVWDEDNDCPVNGRCRNHGGMSTGPKTQEGRRRIGEAAR